MSIQSAEKVTYIQRGTSYRLRIELDHKVGGKRAFKYETVKTKAEAEKRKAQLVLGVGQASAVTGGQAKEPIIEYMQRMMVERTGTGSLAPNSVKIYTWLMEVLRPHVGHLTIGGTTHKDVIKVMSCVTSSGFSPRSVKLAKQRLSGAFLQAVTEGIRADNPAAGVKTAKTQMTAGRIMSDQERGRLLAVARGHVMGPVIRLLLSTGMRRGEVCGLTWRNVNLDLGQVEVVENLTQVNAICEVRAPKTTAGHRTIGLPASVVAELVEMKAKQNGQPGDPVFLSARAQRWVPGNLSRAVSVLMDEAGLPEMGPHDLRHCHASALLRSRMNLRAVATRLGHADPAVTLRIYAHCLPNDDAALTTAAADMLV